MKSRKIALTMVGVLAIIVINISISGKLNLVNNMDLSSLISFQSANAEDCSCNCSVCGSGDSTCSVSSDGGKTWTSCTDVKGIEAVN